MEPEITFGERMKELRLREKLSLRDLATQVGLSAGYLSQLENNKLSISGFPSEENIAKIASILNADQTEFALLAGKLSSEITNGLKDGLLSGSIKKEQVLDLFRSVKK